MIKKIISWVKQRVQTPGKQENEPARYTQDTAGNIDYLMHQLDRLGVEYNTSRASLLGMSVEEYLQEMLRIAWQRQARKKDGEQPTPAQAGEQPTSNMIEVHTIGDLDPKYIPAPAGEQPIDLMQMFIERKEMEFVKQMHDAGKGPDIASQVPGKPMPMHQTIKDNIAAVGNGIAAGVAASQERAATISRKTPEELGKEIEQAIEKMPAQEREKAQEILFKTGKTVEQIAMSLHQFFSAIGNFVTDFIHAVEKMFTPAYIEYMTKRQKHITRLSYRKTKSQARNYKKWKKRKK